MAKNVRALIHALGGQAAVQLALENKGHDITVGGIEAMCARNSIAGKWIPRLQKLADDEKIKLSVTDYLHDEEAADND